MLWPLACLLAIYDGFCKASLVNLVPANLRTTALGLAVVLMYVLGDGLAAGGRAFDATGAGASRLARDCHNHRSVFHLNPHTQTLSMALLLMPIAMLVSDALYALGLTTPEGKET